MNIKFFLREYIQKLPYIVLLTIVCIGATYIFHGHFVFREIFVNALAMNILVMYWNRWFPAYGEFRLQESLLQPAFLMVLAIVPLSLYLSSSYIPYAGEHIKMNTFTYMASMVLAAITHVSLDKSRHANNA